MSGDAHPLTTGAGHPVRVRGLRTQFGAHVVHDALDLTARQGEVLGVVGGSGTGKSVLLNTLIGLRRPDAGDVRVLGEPLYALADGARQAVERRFGMLFQNGALFSSLTVKENITAPLREHTDAPAALCSEIAEMKIALAGLPTEAANKYPSELSGGMRKRAGLARALALDPELVFLDEPTAGLDPLGAAAFDDLIATLCETLGLTVVMVTHDLDSLHAVCDRVAVLADKRVVETAPVADLMRTQHPWIQAYFNGPRGRAALRTHQAQAHGDPAAGWTGAE